MNRKLGVVAVVACFGLVGGIALADPIPSKVTIDHSFGDSLSWHFDGVVDSAKSKCIQERHVVIYRLKPSGAWEPIAGTKTDEFGNWTIEFENPKKGRYRAEIFRDAEPGRDCAGDISNRVTVTY